MPVNNDIAAATLVELFEEVQPYILQGGAPPTPPGCSDAFDTIFGTGIQSYREALLGIALVRMQDRGVNLRLPYVNQGPDAYNGRELDEQVVNPFLQQNRIPCSGGPYLAMFRRDFRFDDSRRKGQRNPGAFDAFIKLIADLEGMAGDGDIQAFLTYLLYRFARLRESAEVRVSRLQRISLEQYKSLIASLLNTQSGGRLPVILVVATFRTVKDYFGLDWVIEHQGINVADAQTGAGGDITVKHAGGTVFAAEVTERLLERSRVISTFNTKIAPHGIEDYLFFVRSEALSAEAQQQAKQYFAQGHELNFLEIGNWILMVLATTGRRGRELFNQHMLQLIDSPTMPRTLKVAWNDYIAALTAPP